MYRAFLPKALALAVLTAGLTIAGAQQTQPAPEASQPANAPHQRHHHAPDPQRQAEMLSKKLNLTPDQTARVEPILQDRDQKMQSLFQNQQLTPQDRHEQMRAIHQSTEQQLSGVLSPDQMTQFKGMRHHAGRWHHGNSTDPGQTPSV